jgi:hypothetical protein
MVHTELKNDEAIRATCTRVSASNELGEFQNPP